MAWPAVVSNLKRYEVIDVHVQPELFVEHVDGPPGYHIATRVEESKESKEFFARSEPRSKCNQTKPSKNKHPAAKDTSKPTIRLK
jgi:hypothetical protein